MDEKTRSGILSRRNAMSMMVGGAAGIGALLTGMGEGHATAQQAPPQTSPMGNPIPPAQDPRFPQAPVWETELRLLAPHVYAFVQAGGPGKNNVSVSNAGMIEGPDYLVAVDATEGPIPAQRFISDSKKATGKSFGRMVNTHHHGDHVDGNQFFLPAEIISHPYCRTECVKAAQAQANNPNQRTFAAHEGVALGTEPRKLAVQNTTIEDNFVQYVGDTRVEWIYAGPAHTWGDLMAYLPQHKILFAGDVAFFWVAPFAQNGHISKWIETCDRILGMDVDTIVPGHGPIGGKKDLAEMADYFRVLTVEARKRYQQKMSAGAAAADIRMGRFDNWIGPERIVMDTARLYDEWNGSLIPDVNVGGIREATLEYNEAKMKAAARK